MVQQEYKEALLSYWVLHQFGPQKLDDIDSTCEVGDSAACIIALHTLSAHS